MKKQLKPKKRKVSVEKDEYFLKCPYCKKEIKGSTTNQILWNMNIHIKTKHKEVQDE